MISQQLTFILSHFSLFKTICCEDFFLLCLTWFKCVAKLQQIFFSLIPGVGIILLLSPWTWGLIHIFPYIFYQAFTALFDGRIAYWNLYGLYKWCFQILGSWADWLELPKVWKMLFRLLGSFGNFFPNADIGGETYYTLIICSIMMNCAWTGRGLWLARCNSS